MKRTSYIILGVLLGGLLLMSGIILYMSKHGADMENNQLYFTGARKTLPLPECKVLRLERPTEVYTTYKGVEQTKDVSFAEVPLEVRPADPHASGSFSLAADLEPFMTIKSSGDTVTISFTFPREKLDEAFADARWLNLISEVGMELALSSGVQSVISEAYDQKTTFTGFERDSLSLSFENVFAPVAIEESNFRSLHIQSGRRFLFNSGSIQHLHLCLDEVDYWNVNTDSCRIDTEYLSGSRNLQCTLQQNECKQVFWKPLAENITLNVALSSEAKIELVNRPDR